MCLPVIKLASGSPRRREILTWLGWPFERITADIDETPFAEEKPGDYVLRLAEAKARAAGCYVKEEALILAADTTVADGSALLGKPGNPREAFDMLARLRGRVHQVYTAVALLKNGRLWRDLCVSAVPMRMYSDDEIEAYIASGDPLDKAGAYAIQNGAFQPVENFHGCFASVTGLPICHLVRTLKRMGCDVPVEMARFCLEHYQYHCPIYQEVLAYQDAG